MEKDIKLVNERILLRPYRPDDAARVYEAACESVHEVGMWLPWCHAGYTMEESKNWIKLCGETWDKAFPQKKNSPRNKYESALPPHSCLSHKGREEFPHLPP